MEAQPVESLGWYDPYPQPAIQPDRPSDPVPYQDPAVQSAYGHYAPPPYPYEPAVAPPPHHYQAHHGPPPHHHSAFQPPPLGVVPATPRPRTYDYWPEQYPPEGYGYPRYGPGPRYPEPSPGPSYMYGGGEGPGFRPREPVRVYGGHPYGYPAHARPRYPRYPVERNKPRYGESSSFNQKKFARRPVKVVRPSYCELCKVQCNSEDAYSWHMSGKRHGRNLEKLKEKYTPKPFKPSQEYLVEEPAVGAVKSEEEPVTEEPPAVPAKPVQKVSVKEEPHEDEDVPAPVVELQGEQPTQDETQNPEAEKQTSPEGAAEEEPTKKAADNAEGSTLNQKKFFRRPGKVPRPAFCEICRVECNSEEAFAGHVSGRKHAKRLEMMLEKYTPKNLKSSQRSPSREPSAGSYVPTPPVNKTRKRPMSPIDSQDIEAKKKRLLDDGATPEDVRVCTLCHVVCNSEIVYRYHLAGQKHAAMVKMQATTNPVEETKPLAEETKPPAEENPAEGNPPEGNE